MAERKSMVADDFREHGLMEYLKERKRSGMPETFWFIGVICFANTWAHVLRDPSPCNGELSHQGYGIQRCWVKEAWRLANLATTEGRLMSLGIHFGFASRTINKQNTCLRLVARAALLQYQTSSWRAHAISNWCV